MRIENKQSFTKWKWDIFYLLPSICFYAKRGTVHNYDVGKIQNCVDFQIGFNFLWFIGVINLFITWGNKGVLKRNTKSLYKCSRCHSFNVKEDDQGDAGLCHYCEEVDYWEFIEYIE